MVYDLHYGDENIQNDGRFIQHVLLRENLHGDHMVVLYKAYSDVFETSGYYDTKDGFFYTVLREATDKGPSFEFEKLILTLYAAAVTRDGSSLSASLPEHFEVFFERGKQHIPISAESFLRGGKLRRTDGQESEADHKRDFDNDNYETKAKAIQGFTRKVGIGKTPLRFTLATGNSPGNDMRFSDERVQASRNFCNKIWNASRFIQMNLTIDKDKAVQLPADLTIEDKWIISKFNRKAADISQLRMVQWAFRVILFICGTKVTVIGEENVPKDEAVLYIGNHKSYFDIIITYARCPGLTGYVAKNDMAKVPLLSLWMKRLYCLFINRDDVKEALKTILAGIDHIKNGISMCIFPEGTRNKTDDLMLPFKEGSFKMAEKTGCAIVPMAITGSADILENHFPKVKATHVILEYGKPIYPNELDKETKKKIGAHCQGVIEEMLVKNEKLQ